MAKKNALAQWVKKQGHGAKSRLARASGLALSTVDYAIRGDALRYDTAVKLSKATGGAVPIKAFPLIGDDAVAA